MQLVRPMQREYRTWLIDNRRWAPYQPRAADIIISTPPKCGTTWMQQIVGSLVFQDSEARPLNVVSPWIDGRAGRTEETHHAIEAQKHRRFLKSHTPLDGLPLHDGVRYIFVGRDGRDALMSLHNFLFNLTDRIFEVLDRIGLDDPMIGRPLPRIPPDPAELFRQWISQGVVPGQTDGTPSASLFDHTLSFWTERRRANVLLVHFDDLRADLDGEMRRIAAFLDIDIDHGKWPALVEAATFDRMRDRGEILMPQFTTTNLTGGAERFFHKGSGGRWKDVLTDDYLRLYDAKIREKFSPDVAAWMEGGRRRTGDPANL